MKDELRKFEGGRIRDEFCYGNRVDDSVAIHRNADLRSRTKSFATSVIKFYSGLPKTTEIQIIGKQLFRSGTSVGANYREASRSRSKAELIAKLGICIQEADETQYWLECLKDGCNFNNETLNSLWQECDELIRIFTTSSRTAKANSTLKEEPALTQFITQPSSFMLS